MGSERELGTYLRRAKRWRKAKDYSARACRNSKPDMSTHSVWSWFSLCCDVRENWSLKTSFTFMSLASCFPACSFHGPSPHQSFCIHVSRLHVLGQSQILVSYSSSCTNSTPSLREEKKFSECLFFGCLEIYFLCHLLVIPAFTKCILAPQNLVLNLLLLNPYIGTCFFAGLLLNTKESSIHFNICRENGTAAFKFTF